jgi:hypothetical protein
MAGQGAGPQLQGPSQGGGESPAQVYCVLYGTAQATLRIRCAQLREIRQILRHPKGIEDSERTET